MPGNICLTTLGVIPYASDSYAVPYGPNWAMDGVDDNTNGENMRWNSDIHALPNTWLAADFGSAKSIDKWRVSQFGGGTYKYATSLNVQYSTVSDTGPWTTAHSATGLGVDSGVQNLSTPATARWWRILAVAESGGTTNGWGVFTLELHGADPPDPITISLPFLTDADVLYDPTVLLNPLVDLPFLAEADTLYEPTILSQLGVFLPFLSDADTMFEPSVSGGLQVVLPFLSDPDTMFEPTLFMPVVAVVTLPLLDEPDQLFEPSLQATPAVIDLPYISDEDDYGLEFYVIVEPLPIRVTVSTRVFGEDDYEGTIRYELNQTLEIRATFVDHQAQAADPLSCRISSQDPNGFENAYVYGLNTENERVEKGVYRVRVSASIPGRWYYRGEGISREFDATDEASFVVSKSEFGV